jgi:putative hydrolase of the HAD superfamily
VTIRAILFDLGNTVLEYGLAGHWREFRLTRLEEMYPIVCETAAPAAASAAEFAHIVGDVIGGAGARAIELSGRSWHFRERLRQGLAAVGVNADADHIERLTDLFYQPIHECNRPYPDTSETLSRVRGEGLRLAVITNAPWDTPARLLRSDLEQWHCADFFDAFICSGEVPWRKPNPRFMLAAAEALGIPADECLVVGDSLEADIAGANAAGMRSVWMDPAGACAPADGPQPDRTARSLSDVLELVFPA